MPFPLYDLALPLSERTAVYPGDPIPRLERTSDLGLGDALTCSQILLGCHVGTHIDAPAHFVSGGRSLAQLARDAFHGPALVLDSRGRQAIGGEDVERLRLPSRHHLLFRTDNEGQLSSGQAGSPACWLERSAAAPLIAARPLSVGFDHYNLDAPEAGDYPVQRELAGAGIPLYAALDLLDVPAGLYRLVAAPLRLEEAEAAPARVWLFETPEATARRKLRILRDRVRDFGSALGAMDHGFEEAARRIEAEAEASIRALFEDDLTFRLLMPQLWHELQRGAPLSDEGTRILGEMDEAFAKLGRAQRAQQEVVG